jgi:hypothetical protein
MKPPIKDQKKGVDLRTQSAFICVQSKKALEESTPSPTIFPIEEFFPQQPLVGGRG